ANRDAAGNTVRTHLTPDGEILKWAIELNVPVKRVGLRFELVHQSMSLAQYNDLQAPTNLMTGAPGSLSRSGPFGGGQLDGTGWYVEVYAWILGDVNYLESPGLELHPRLKKFT